MKTIKRLFPVVCITCITLLTSFLLYDEIMEREEVKCWNELSSTAQSVNKAIATKFQDEIVKLHLVEEVMLGDELFDKKDAKQLHLNMLQPTTIFSRIDVLYPDNTLVSNGVEIEVDEDIFFADLKGKEEYLTTRQSDFLTGEECVYYILPVSRNEEVLAILIGVVDAQALLNYFQPNTYKGQINICIIDTKDGSYIMDSWHKELGNAYESGMRKKLKGYEDVDLQADLKKLATGRVAFESRTTGNPLYMYYTPVNLFDWSLAIFAEEEVLFGDLLSLQKVFAFAGVFEGILLVLYFVWNIQTVRLLEKSNAEIVKQKEQLEYISYMDVLTCVYNRNKYEEVLHSFVGQHLKNTGTIYIDLNGLKQINDTQSHAAGDRYIHGAAQVMHQVFGENSYRIGGDEFVILSVGIDKKEFESKITALQERMLRDNISISIGWSFAEYCDDLDTLLKEAEQKMYADKERYYLTHERRK